MHRLRTATAGDRGGDGALTFLPGAVLATVLAVWGFDEEALWRDEWYTLATAGQGWDHLVAVVSGPDVALSGYYALMHVWLLADQSSAWLRLPSALGTVAAALLCASVGRRVGGTRVGALSGVLVVCTLAVSQHAAEARPYPLVITAVTAVAALALRHLDRPSARTGAGLAVVAVVAVCLHPLPGVPAVAGTLLGLLLASPRHQRPGVIARGLPAAVTGLTLVALGYRNRVPRAGGAVDLLDVTDFRYNLAQQWWPAALVLALAVLGATRLPRKRAVVVGCWAVAPPAAVAALGLSGGYFEYRYASSMVPAVCVLAAAGAAAAVRSRRDAVVVVPALAALVLAPTLGTAVSDRMTNAPIDDPRAAAASVTGLARPGDAVVFLEGADRGMFDYYAPDDLDLVDALLLRTPLQSGTIAGIELPAQWWPGAVRRYDRVWVVGGMVDGAWRPGPKVPVVTAGRVLDHTDDHGAYRVQLWTAPA